MWTVECSVSIWAVFLLKLSRVWSANAVSSDLKRLNCQCLGEMSHRVGEVACCTAYSFVESRGALHVENFISCVTIVNRPAALIRRLERLLAHPLLSGALRSGNASGALNSKKAAGAATEEGDDSESRACDCFGR